MTFISEYNIAISKDALKYLDEVGPDIKKVIIDTIKLCLGKYLFVNTPRCNKKALKGSKEGNYRLHIRMRYTAFYQIENSESQIYINEIYGINEAHDKY